MNMEKYDNSQYVLLQFGDFNINFLKKFDPPIEFRDMDANAINTILYSRNKDDLITLAHKIAINQPEELTNEEAKNVITALLHFTIHGTDKIMSTEEEFIERLMHAS